MRVNAMMRVVVLSISLIAPLSLAYETGLVLSPGWEDLAPWDDMQEVDAKALPARWDWRDQIPMPPVKDQKECGSCMTFSVVGVVEAIYRIAKTMHYDRTLFSGAQTDGDPDDGRINLSEQTLVSRCSPHGDCGGGDYGHFDFVRDTGLPYEQDDPYLAQNSACKQTEKKVRIASWTYVGDKKRAKLFGGPEVAEIKAALYTYGPLSITMNGSINYTSGVFTDCGLSSQNHAVVLVGYVDDPEYEDYGGGYWIVRNSWGNDWGEGGYFRAVYRHRFFDTPCHGVAGVAAYAVLPGMANVWRRLR